MSSEGKLKVVIKLGQLNKIADLQVIVENLEEKEIQDICEQQIKANDINTFFHYLMKGFTDSTESKEKRLNVVLFILKCCNRIELSMKCTLDLVTRLCADLESFPNDHIIQFVENCIDSIRLEESKTVYWKDFLPQLLAIVCNLASVDVNGIPMSGVEYRSAILKNITLLKWRLDILTPLAAMFKEIHLIKDEREQIITKLCENLFQLQTTELPGLALQLFGLCDTPAMIVIPILFFQKYFNKYYFSKEYENMDSNTTHYDSIDLHSPQEMQEIQETILYHLSNCTEFKLNEKDVVSVFRNLSNTPHYLLTPFMISALLTLSKLNRQPDVVRLSTSDILPFLRKVIRNNEQEKDMCRSSLWCRQTFDRKTVDIDKVISILIDQSITGMEVITPGVVALAFILLKAKNQSDLNLQGMNFLHQFLKKRYIFGQGILKQLSELLFANQEAPQYAECLNTLSLTNTLTISECVSTVQSILDFLLLIPGHHAMRMITFIYPLIKISFAIRDGLIEVLTKAMSQTNAALRRFGVYGFCLVLKNLRNNNSRRAAGQVSSSNNLSFTQGTISGYSLMSQSTLGNRDNPQRHFDMLALEIIGILRKCFNETYETKEILYEGLTRAIEFNVKLTTHLLIFMDWHFRSYFEVDGGSLVVKFDQIVKEKNGGVDVWDNIGKLVTFMGTCVMTCEQHHIVHDNKITIDLLSTILDKCDSFTIQSLNLQNDLKSKEVAQQYLFLMEGIMAYATMAQTTANGFMRKFHRVFQHHQKFTTEIKSLFGEKKAGKKVKAAAPAANPVTSTPNCSVDTPALSIQYTICGTQKEAAGVQFKPTNIWEVNTLQKLLKIVFSTSEENQATELREDEDFKRFLLKVVSEHIASFRYLPDYRHVKHSRRMFSFLCEAAQVIYQYCIKALGESSNFDATLTNLCVDCFKQCLLTSDHIYKRKLEDFFLNIGGAGLSQSALHEQILDVIENIHRIVQRSLEENSFLEDDRDGKKIQQNLLACLEILYNYLPTDHVECCKVSNWLYDFCLTNSIDHKHLEPIFKLLFSQRIKYYDGDFFGSVAIQISRIFETLAELDVAPAFELKAITIMTVEPAFMQLCAVLKKEIEDVEYTILKVKSMTAKIKFLGDKGVDDDHIQGLKTMERAICAHLIHIVNALLHLANSRVPLGTPSDTLLRLLTQCYMCLTNVCKHLIARNNVLDVVYGHIKFDKLILAAGKPLAARIYDLISYIDQNLLPDDVEARPATKKGKDPLQTKKKVIRETRSLPKLIRWIETLHKFVILLGKKTGTDISHYLHMGIVRDFRIKSADLVQSLEDNEEDEEGATGNGEDDENEIPETEPPVADDPQAGGSALEKIMKNVGKIKRKGAAAKPAVRGKRSRPAVIVPDVAGILNAISDNAAPKSPAKKKPRRSAKN